MNFAEVNAITIPEGSVEQIAINGSIVWQVASEPTIDKYSWEAVFASIKSGTYATDYAVGDCIPLDLGSEGIVNMQIAAFDTDNLADGSGKAPITWISKEILATSHRMNPSLVTNYIYPEIPSWKASGNTWTSQNRYNVSDAKAVWSITATDAGTLTVSYKTSNGTASGNKISITVNGEAVATDYTSTTAATYDIDVLAGDIVTVEATYSLLSASYNYYGTVTFSGTGAFTTEAVIENAPNRQAESYDEATGSIGGWEKCEMRTYLKDTVKPLIPDAVRNSIVEVTKSQIAYNITGSSFTQTTTDDVWIPDYNEVYSSNCTYLTLFPDNASRIKSKVNATSASSWWLRRAGGTSGFYDINTSGSSYINFAGGSYGVVLGFCT